MRNQLRAACLVVLAALASCTPADSDRTAIPAFTLTDSAGVMRATNGLTDVLPAQIDTAMRIGVAEGDEHYQFHLVRDVKIDSVTGEVFVVNQGSKSVRVFGRDGVFLREFGAEGGGPGEFRSPWMLYLVGDSVFVLDVEKNEMAVFRRSGAFVSTWPSRPRFRSLAFPMGWTPDGWLALVRDTPDMPELGPGREFKEVQSVRFFPGLGRNDPTPASSSDNNVVSVEISMFNLAGGFSEFPLFGPIPAITADGRGEAYVHHGAPYAIDVYDKTGALVRRITREHEPVPITRDMIAEFERRVKARRDSTVATRATESGGGADEQAVDLARVSIPRPDALPPLGALLVAQNGALWVRRLDLESDPVAYELRGRGGFPRGGSWDRFDAEGRFLGSVQLPETFSPRSVTANSVAGVLRDELGVEYVVRYVVQNN